jgi:ABC-type bacteriocin/lantibiotic exporter with double-glycine peptidase domain
MTLPKLSQVLVLYFGGLMVHNDMLSVGRLVAFLIYVSILTDACNDLAGIYAAMTRALGDAERVFDILNRQPQHTTRNEGTPPVTHEIDVSSCANGSVGVKYRNVATRRLSGLSPQACDGTITLKDISMSYAARPHRTVLENLSLTIPAGSVASLVGSSGSGKTSILSVIQSLYEPAKGEVCIDGIPVRPLLILFLRELYGHLTLMYTFRI